MVVIIVNVDKLILVNDNNGAERIVVIMKVLNFSEKKMFYRSFE